jgi:hypothetical protein
MEEWQSVYLDATTGDEWFRYPLWDYHGPGPECLRRGNPALSDILKCIVETDQDTEVSAAAFHLVNCLDGHAENLRPMLDRLETVASSNPSARVLRNIALAIAWTKAERSFNHRSPLGKSPAEVSADAELFQGLSERAASLKVTVEGRLGYGVSQKTTVFT